MSAYDPDPMVSGPFPLHSDDPVSVLAVEVAALRRLLEGAERERITNAAEHRQWRLAMDARLQAIEQHTAATNGKVAALEADRIAREAVEQARPLIRAEAIEEARPTIQHDEAETIRLRSWRVHAWAFGAGCTVVIVVATVVDKLGGGGAP